MENQGLQQVVRADSFDCAHRVMNEKMKCFNLHGHTYLVELDFSFFTMQEIGYAIDFKEIKRVGLQWIQDVLDHGVILNPKDQIVIDASRSIGSKMWLMSLNGQDQYCNPTVENIAKELFLAMEILFSFYKEEGLTINSIKLHETPNCYTVCTKQSIFDAERRNFRDANADNIQRYAIGKGRMEYDDRKS